MSHPRDEPKLSSSGRAFVAGVVGNLGMAVLKLGAGWLAGSPAMVADGWHSLADAVMNGTVWIVHGFSMREPDEDHHFGHGKLEALGSMVVGALLCVGGATLAISAFEFGPLPELGWPVWIALGVAILSIATNLYLARLALRAVEHGNSEVLSVLARDNLSDALASGLVVIAILGSLADLPWPEPVATFVIGLVIVTMGLRPAREGFDVLMDRSDPDLRVEILRSARKAEGVRWVQRVRVHPIGRAFVVDLNISVPGTLSVEEGHRIAHEVEDAVTRDHPLVREVHVHVDPVPRSQPLPERPASPSAGSDPSS